jgi:hypothetical protein
MGMFESILLLSLRVEIGSRVGNGIASEDSYRIQGMRNYL